MQVAKHINEDKPDFVVSLGDPFDLHGLGFTPALTKEQAAGAHAHARTFFSKLNESGAMYQVWRQQQTLHALLDCSPFDLRYSYKVLGNWEGESGCHPTEERMNAILARQAYQV